MVAMLGKLSSRAVFVFSTLLSSLFVFSRIFVFLLLLVVLFLVYTSFVFFLFTFCLSMSNNTMSYKYIKNNFPFFPFFLVYVTNCLFVFVCLCVAVVYDIVLVIFAHYFSNINVLRFVCFLCECVSV